MAASAKALSGNIVTGGKGLSAQMETERTDSGFSGEMVGELHFGAQGPPGPAGRSPVRGVDYWTETDKREIVEEVKKEVGGVDFETDETLQLEDGILSVNVIDEVIEDNLQPVTSGAVYNEFSKAVALLKTI